jgi:hypothetical protein
MKIIIITEIPAQSRAEGYFPGSTDDVQELNILLQKYGYTKM